MLRYVIFFLVLLVFACAGNNKSRDSSQLAGKRIHFGFGGGFSGVMNHYFLYPDGGMGVMARTLQKIAEENGVKFHFNAALSELECADNRVKKIKVNEIYFYITSFFTTFILFSE